MTNDKPQRGGKRAGAGRKPRSASLSDSFRLVIYLPAPVALEIAKIALEQGIAAEEVAARMIETVISIR